MKTLAQTAVAGLFANYIKRITDAYYAMCRDYEGIVGAGSVVEVSIEKERFSLFGYAHSDRHTTPSMCCSPAVITAMSPVLRTPTLVDLKTTSEDMVFFKAKESAEEDREIENYVEALSAIGYDEDTIDDLHFYNLRNRLLSIGFTVIDDDGVLKISKGHGVSCIPYQMAVAVKTDYYESLIKASIEGKVANELSLCVKCLFSDDSIQEETFKNEKHVNEFIRRFNEDCWAVTTSIHDRYRENGKLVREVKFDLSRESSRNDAIKKSVRKPEDVVLPSSPPSSITLEMFLAGSNDKKDQFVKVNTPRNTGVITAGTYEFSSSAGLFSNQIADELKEAGVSSIVDHLRLHRLNAIIGDICCSTFIGTFQDYDLLRCEYVWLAVHKTLDRQASAQEIMDQGIVLDRPSKLKAWVKSFDKPTGAKKPARAKPQAK